MIPRNISNLAMIKNTKIKKMMATLIVLHEPIFRYVNVALCSTWTAAIYLLFITI